ncbi:MAG: oligosaccharide flippase family protein, partial [Erysipelotrichia bacterium]|nr:oligosaccharide flippase family protein [Erysipelotrichia bacterium]
LTFFIPDLIEKMPNISENIYLIYIFFLLDTVASYFFTYRVAIIQADQKNYIVVKTVQTFKIVQIIVQIIVLYLTHNYYCYLILQLTCTVCTYLYLFYKSKKMYPYTISLPKKSLPKEERKNIFDNVKALFVYKIGSVVLNGTDSIIISKYLGLVVLGLYSNYLLIINALAQILSQIFNAFTASIGNLIALDKNGKSKEVFDQLFYFTTFVYCIISICLYLLFNDFINIWLGEKYLLSDFVVLSIVLHFYINGTQFAAFTYRQTSGLFKQYRWSPIVASVVNIVLSIVLAQKIGLAGVFLATSVSRITTAGWIDPLIIYKRVFKDNVCEYYVKYIFCLIKTFIFGVICGYVTAFLTVNDIWTFILKGLVVAFLSALLFLGSSFYQKEFKQLKVIGLNLLKGRVKK